LVGAGLGGIQVIELSAEAVEEDGSRLAKEEDDLCARDAEVVLAHLGVKINLITST